jgi:S1-C subfamily serine protease
VRRWALGAVTLALVATGSSCVAPPTTTTSPASTTPAVATTVRVSPGPVSSTGTSAETSAPATPVTAAGDESATTSTAPSAEFARARSHAVVRIRTVSCEGIGIGSGFLVDDTTIITARHVVEGASTVEVETWDGRVLVVSDVRQAQVIDLGVITVENAAGQPALTLADADVSVAAGVFAVGYPEGNAQATTEGHVLSFFSDTRYGTLGEIMRFDAPIKPGNSGGPLTSADNEVVGVVYAVDLHNGDSLAVPVTSLRRLLDSGTDLVETTVC